jgi:putative membrane protein
MGPARKGADMKMTRFSLTSFTALVSLVLLGHGSEALAQWRGYGYDGWHMGPGTMYWILVIVGLIFVIRWLLQSTRGDSRWTRAGSSSALDILKERYARGEINKQEFEEKKKDLLS